MASEERSSRVIINLSTKAVGGIKIDDLMVEAAEHESPNEKLAIHALSLCHDVAAIRSQKIAIPYFPGNPKKKFHPDLEVELAGEDAPVLVEVKAIEWLFKSESIVKYLEICRYLKSCGRKIHFLTDDQLKQDPLRYNVSLLSQYRTGYVPDKRLEEIVASIDRPTSIEELVRQGVASLAEIYTLIARGSLSFGWSKKINRNSEVGRPKKDFARLEFKDLLHSGRFYPALEELALGCEPSNKRLVAATQVRRQPDRVHNVFGMCGTFAFGKPMRDLAESEQKIRSAWMRRDQAIGENDSAKITEPRDE